MTDEQRRRVEDAEQRVARDLLRGVRPPPLTVSLDQGHVGMVLLALAHLSVERPGWTDALRAIADHLDGDDVFDVLRAELAAQRQAAP